MLRYFSLLNCLLHEEHEKSLLSLVRLLSLLATLEMSLLITFLSSDEDELFFNEQNNGEGCWLGKLERKISSLCAFGCSALLKDCLSLFVFVFVMKFLLLFSTLKLE